jgi:hypothetical protein
MKIRRIWFILGGLVLVIAAFLLINFHAAVSNTQAERNITTTSIGEGLPVAMQRRDKITIIVTGEGLLVPVLQKAMLVEMRKAGMANVELVQEPESAYKNPVLIMKIGKPELFWTPFFATSRFTVQAGYASNGKTPLMKDTPILDNTNGPALNMNADIKVNDQSWGILSRPGYDQILADWLAHNIVEATMNIYGGGAVSEQN